MKTPSSSKSNRSSLEAVLAEIAREIAPAKESHEFSVTDLVEAAEVLGRQITRRQAETKLRQLVVAGRLIRRTVVIDGHRCSVYAKPIDKRRK